MNSTERLSKLDSLVIALSLEVALLQLRILESCTELRSQQWHTTDDSSKMQREKLTRDRYMVHDVIRRTLIEVADAGEWQILQEAIKAINQHALSAIRQRLHYEELRRSCQQMSEELLTKKTQCQVQLQSMDHKIALLKDKMNDDIQNANARLCYTEKWLLARAESLELEHQIKIEPNGSRRTEYEKRVHEELLKAYEIQIKERKANLEHWQKRFSVDTTRINQDLSNMCDQLRVIDKKRTELQKLYDLHSGEIRSWLTFKRERAARLEREARLRTSATKIQSWWRGVMVRAALGAFRYLKNNKKSAAKPKKK